MYLLLDIGNTHTHAGLANGRRIVRHLDTPTEIWRSGRASDRLLDWFGHSEPSQAAFCSVVPHATPSVRRFLRNRYRIDPLQLTPGTLTGIGIRYPKPETIGQDRLANAVAARRHYGAPCVVVDFGTAVTFDIVDRAGNYVGGIIAPGLAAMTDYLHDKTALLPRIKVRETTLRIGKSTQEAMLIGAVHGYRGLIRELLGRIKTEIDVARLPVVATGGYAKLIAAKMPEITAVDPLLTLEGLRINFFLSAQADES